MLVEPVAVLFTQGHLPGVCAVAEPNQPVKEATVQQDHAVVLCQPGGQRRLDGVALLIGISRFRDPEG